MTITRTQYEKSSKERAADKLSDRHLSAVLHLVHAAVPLETLTNSPEWDRYLQLITALLEIASKQEQELVGKLSWNGTVNHDELMLTKIQLAMWRGRAGALQDVLSLPKQVLEAAARAKESMGGQP